MSKRQLTDQTRSLTVPPGLRHLLNGVVLVVALGLLGYHLLTAIAAGFAQGSWVGVRSLAASIFPLLVAIYVRFLVSVRLSTNASRAPVINNFIVFTLWMMVLLGLDRIFVFQPFPLEEFLYSLTLAAMLWRFKGWGSLDTLVACSYGIVCGSLGALIVFG